MFDLYRRIKNWAASKKDQFIDFELGHPRTKEGLSKSCLKLGSNKELVCMPPENCILEGTLQRLQQQSNVSTCQGSTKTLALLLGGPHQRVVFSAVLPMVKHKHRRAFFSALPSTNHFLTYTLFWDAQSLTSIRLHEEIEFLWKPDKRGEGCATALQPAKDTIQFRALAEKSESLKNTAPSEDRHPEFILTRYSNSKPYFKYYHYDPSLAAACVFAIIFGLSTVWHLVLIAKHKTRYFVPLLIGGIFEIVGYAARGVSSTQAPNLTIAPYVIQTLLILVAPALLAASMYMILGRIIISVDGESYSLIKTRWLTKVFVTSDVITFFVQLAGGGLMASSHASTATMGSRIVLAGLLIQIIIFGFFIAVALIFQRRLRALPTPQSRQSSLPWNMYLNLLYITSTFIMARSIVRVAEFIEGFEGTIILHEVFLYVFDAVPMAAVMVVFNIWYPSDFSNLMKKPQILDEEEQTDIEL
ncbi:hypothetical protein G7046_g3776 [Stylonectria norvegica]|nr:hypothetical protein G7046_g3776 [Stylonectria norvegica]